MRRVAFAILVLLMTFSTGAAVKVIAIKHVAAGGGGFCDGTFEFCQDFTTDLSAWTEPDTDVNGDWTVGSGILNGPSTASGVPMIVYTADTGGLNQYACIKFETYSGQQGVMMRYNSATRHYGIVVSSSDNIAYWSSYESTGAWKADNDSCSLTLAAGNYLCGRINGTGAGTVVDIWKYTTAPTTAPTGTGDCRFSHAAGAGDDADTGLKVGITYEGPSAGKTFDNWAGGGS